MATVVLAAQRFSLADQVHEEYANTDPAWVTAYEQDTGWRVHHLGTDNPDSAGYHGECPWFVKAVRRDRLPAGNAWEMLGRCRTAGYATGDTPKPGCIAVWSSSVGGGYGHVALVKALHDDGTLEVWDSNWGEEAKNSVYTDGMVRRRSMPLGDNDRKHIVGYVYWSNGVPEPPADEFPPPVQPTPDPPPPEPAPPRISAPILVLDRSGSMSGVQDELNRHAEQCVDGLLARTSRMAVVNFQGADSATVDAPLCSDRSRILKAIREPSLRGGGTALYDAVIEAVKEARRADESALLIAMTDGEDNSSRASLGQAIQWASTYGVRCCVISFAGGSDPYGLTGSDHIRSLRDLCTRTRGVYITAREFTPSMLLDKVETFQRVEIKASPVKRNPPAF